MSELLLPCMMREDSNRVLGGPAGMRAGLIRGSLPLCTRHPRLRIFPHSLHVSAAAPCKKNKGGVHPTSAYTLCSTCWPSGLSFAGFPSSLQLERRTRPTRLLAHTSIHDAKIGRIAFARESAFFKRLNRSHRNRIQAVTLSDDSLSSSVLSAPAEEEEGGWEGNLPSSHERWRARGDPQHFCC